MALAGIYEFWRDAALPDDHPAAWLWTAAIITTQATDHMGWVHDRMPMVVSPVHWDEWLDPATGDADSLLKTITPAASDDLETRPVSTAVNSVANDGPDLITAITGITALAAGGESGDILAADQGETHVGRVARGREGCGHAGRGTPIAAHDVAGGQEAMPPWMP